MVWINSGFVDHIVERLERSFVRDGEKRSAVFDELVAAAPLLDRLISVAFATSLRRLEGRYPLLTIGFNLSQSGLHEKIAAFDSALPFSEEVLHILWPSIPAYPGYLVVERVEDELAIVAIEPPLPGDHLVGFFSDQLFVAVRGPGDIDVILARWGKAFRFSGRGFREVKVLSSTAVTDDFKHLFRDDADSALGFWIPILQKVSNAREGGAFVQLAKPYDFGKLDIKFPIAIDRFYEAKDANRYLHPNRGFSRARQHLACAMSRVDGCVVLNEDRMFFGFGAKITSNTSTLPRCLTLNGEPSEFKLSDRGTRHRAGAKFAFDFPGSIVAVVSQDGDVHIFRKWTECEGLTVYGPFADVAYLSPPLFTYG